VTALVAMLIVGYLAVVVGKAFVAGDKGKARRVLRGSTRTMLDEHPGRARAKVIGTVRAIETLVAPISQRPCVLYQIRVEAQSESVDDAAWTPLLVREEGVPFLIADGTDRARVDPEGAQISLLHDRHLGDGNEPDEDGRGAAFLARYGKSPSGRRLRFSEGIIEEGERIAVSGLGSREPDREPPSGERGYRDGPATILHIATSTEHPLYVSDRPDTLD
jgi:hypothetical protein